MTDAAVIHLPARPLHEIESQLLGAVLELEERREIIEASGLTRDDFTSVRVGLVWSIVARLAARRMEVSALTVVSRGKTAGLLNDSDLAWLNDLLQANLATREQALQVAEEVRAQARARQVRAALQAQIDIIDRGRFHPGRTLDALSVISKGLVTGFSIDETADVDLLELNQQWDENVRTGQAMLIPTGIRVLDQALGGGTPRNFWVLQGRPGSGKNMVMTSMIRGKLLVDHQTTRRTKIGLIGLENGTAWLTRRWQAEDLGLAQRDIGSKALSPEEQERKARVDQLHFDLLKRVHVYRHDGANIGELVRRIMRWVFEEEVTEVLIDNLREIEQNGDYLAHVTRVVKSLRDVAGKFAIPIGLAVHDMEDAVKGKDGPPNPDRMQGGKGPGALARCVVGTWRNGPWSYRATVTKHEMGEARWPNGPTCEFKANYSAGTMELEAGRVIDLDDEAAKEKREAKERANVENAVNSIERQEIAARIKAERAASKPAEPKKEEPQAQLPLEEPRP